MSNVDVNDIRVTPDNTLLVWELTVLQAIKTFPSLEREHKVDYLLLGKSDLQERGLRQIHKDSQHQAIESMVNRKELIAKPIFPAAYLPDGTAYDANINDPVGYTVTVFDSGEIDELINEKLAQLKGKLKVTVAFETNDDTVTLRVNDFELTGDIGSWDGDLLKALAEGNGETKAISIRDYDEGFETANKQMIKNTVAKINKKVQVHTGVSKLFTGNNVVKLNRDLHLIEFQK